MRDTDERKLPWSLATSLKFMTLLAGVMGVGLFFGSAHTKGYFAWVPDSPITAATLGAGYLAGATLFTVALGTGRWADVRLTVVAAWVQVTATAVATLRGPGLAGLSDGLIATLVAVGWKAFHVVAPVGLLLGWIWATGVAGRLGPRRRSLPRWSFAILVVPALVGSVAGLAALGGVDLLPWPSWGLDGPILGAWMLAAGVTTAGAIVEHDFDRLRSVLWASLVAGGLLTINLLRFPEAGVVYGLVGGLLFLLGAGGLALRFALPSEPAWASWVRADDGPRRGSSRIEPMADAGFFGPASVAWRVWTYPTSLTVGFQRAVVVEELDPFLVASVDATQKIRTQPKVRYDNTIKYFATLVLADSRSAVKASEMLMKVHRRMVGPEPLSGKTYDANDPQTQLWIHLTAWHSILYAYERYGPGPLSEQDEQRYWEDCATAAQLQTCDPKDVPRTREGVRAYFEQVRPQLVGSTVAAQTMDFLLDSKAAFPGWLTKLTPVAWVVNRALRIAVLGTLPKWQRELVGLHQGPLLDLLIVPVMRVSFGFASRLLPLEAFILRAISPSAVPIALPALYGVPPRSTETVTPAEAFARHGVSTPAEIYAGYRSAASA